MISFTHKGDFNKTEALFNNVATFDFRRILNQCGKLGVEALVSATPIDSGITANSWAYEIETSEELVTIRWINTNVVDGVPIAIILQYGHGTGTGGYVQGRDYINPATKPVFDDIEAKVWKEVSEL